LVRLGQPTPDGSPGPLGAAHQSLGRLGRAVAHIAYTGQAATAGLADDAEADRATIIATCRVDLGRKGRLQADLDPRPALARLRADRTRARAAT